ncbi:SRPBCC family protein [Myceligenerans crystallogenes]|uniref:Polyketide cyclase / dehydrase and lipid transport n=1 Tax=Myceligenerans crystallogenes TaxID=316335 RepID=A0ABP4ZY16_9MICO
MAGAAAVWAGAPPSDPPRYDEPRPAPAADGYVTLAEDVVVGLSREEYLAWMNAPGRELGDLVTTDDDSTRVVATVPLSGSWDPAEDRTGHRRSVEFADGHYLAEEVLADSPAEFRYMIWGFTNPQRRLAIRYAVASFVYEEVPGGTRITWTYSFQPTAGILRPVLSSVVNGTIARMMRDSLDAWKAAAEAESVG